MVFCCLVLSTHLYSISYQQTPTSQMYVTRLHASVFSVLWWYIHTVTFHFNSFHSGYTGYQEVESLVVIRSGVVIYKISNDSLTIMPKLRATHNFTWHIMKNASPSVGTIRLQNRKIVLYSVRKLAHNILKKNRCVSHVTIKSNLRIRMPALSATSTCR